MFSSFRLNSLFTSSSSFLSVFLLLFIFLVLSQFIVAFFLYMTSSFFISFFLFLCVLFFSLSFCPIDIWSSFFLIFRNNSRPPAINKNSYFHDPRDFLMQNRLIKPFYQWRLNKRTNYLPLNSRER